MAIHRYLNIKICYLEVLLQFPVNCKFYIVAFYDNQTFFLHTYRLPYLELLTYLFPAQTEDMVGRTISIKNIVEQTASTFYAPRMKAYSI